MNNFLERQKEGLGGPKPKGWALNSSPSRRSPGGGAPAALPSGGGLPVFEKRVQLKGPLPGVARGSHSPVKAGFSPIGWDHSVRTDMALEAVLDGGAADASGLALHWAGGGVTAVAAVLLNLPRHALRALREDSVLFSEAAAASRDLYGCSKEAEAANYTREASGKASLTHLNAPSRTF